MLEFQQRVYLKGETYAGQNHTVVGSCIDFTSPRMQSANSNIYLGRGYLYPWPFTMHITNRWGNSSVAARYKYPTGCEDTLGDG